MLYADYMTESMTLALWETYRRRNAQQQFNEKHDITPYLAKSNVKELDVVKDDADRTQEFQSLRDRSQQKKLSRMTKKEKEIIRKDLKEQLDKAIATWEFETAARLRDQIQELDNL